MFNTKSLFRTLALITLMFASTTVATANMNGASGSGSDAAATQNSAITAAPNTEFNKEENNLEKGGVLLAKPNDYMLDMMGGIIGAKAMSYVFANNGGATGKIFDGYQVKSGTPEITVFSYVLGLLLQGIIVCAAILISWSYLLTSTATAQDGDFLGKKGDSSFLPLRTGGSVLGVAPIEAFGGLSLMQYLVVCAMSLGVVFAGYLSSGVINHTINTAMKEMTSELKPETVAPLLRQIMDTEIKCNFLSKKGIEKTIYGKTPAPIMEKDSSSNPLVAYNYDDKADKNPTLSNTYVQQKSVNMCKVDYETWMGPFFDMIASAFRPDHMTTFKTSYRERLIGTSKSTDNNNGSINDVNDFISILAKESEKSTIIVKKNMHNLMNIIQADTNFLAFRKSVLMQMDAKMDSMQDVKSATDSSEGLAGIDLEEKRAKDVMLFDMAVLGITARFNIQYFGDYKEPTAIRAYSQQLKDAMNSEGFATLGGTVFGLLGISTAIKKATDGAMPSKGKDLSFEDMGIDLEDDDGKEILKMYKEYSGYYSDLYQGASYGMIAASKSEHGMSNSANGFWEGDATAQGLLYIMGFSSNAVKSGVPVMFELRDMGDRSLSYGLILSLLKAGMESKLEALKGGPAGFADDLTGGFLKAMLFTGISALNAVIPYLFILGFVLAFVIPALPWFFWVTAIVGLLIFFAEALIAINIWAIALAHPEGEGPTSQSSAQGIQLLIRLTFQPSVMVASFAFAMVAVDVVGRFVTTMTFSALASSMDSIFSFVGIMTLYMVIMISVTWTIYGVLSQMSSQVFSWVGQASHDMGESKGEQNFMAAMNSSKQVSHAVGGAGGGKESKPEKETKGKD